MWHSRRRERERALCGQLGVQGYDGLDIQRPTEQFLLCQNHTDSVVREQFSNLCPGVVKLSLICIGFRVMKRDHTKWYQD